MFRVKKQKRKKKILFQLRLIDFSSNRNRFQTLYQHFVDILIYLDRTHCIRSVTSADVPYLTSSMARHSSLFKCNYFKIKIGVCQINLSCADGRKTAGIVSFDSIQIRLHGHPNSWTCVLWPHRSNIVYIRKNFSQTSYEWALCFDERWLRWYAVAGVWISFEWNDVLWIASHLGNA